MPEAEVNKRWWRRVESDGTMGDYVKCETCQANNAIGVASVPGVPYSAAYCATCLVANAHPWWLIVGNTAALGGIDEAADWWVEMVEATCDHLGRSMEEFNREVAKAINDEQPS